MALASAHPEVLRRLEAWSGHSVLARVMQELPELRVHVAGGVIRNVLMGLPAASKDVDFFLAGPCVDEAIDRLGRHGRLLRTPFGAPRWFPDAGGTYADMIPVADFVPGLWPCEDIVDVLDQFDFTANAVAFDLRSGEAFDPQNGARDARRRVMKMVRFDYPDGPYVPGATLDRNDVLWLRVVHYASTLGLAIEPFTRDWLASRLGAEAHAGEFANLFFPPDLRAIESLRGRHA